MGPINTSDPAAAAHAYTSLEWSLTLGHRYRPRGGCTCENSECPTPGAHPLPGSLTVLSPERLYDGLASTPGASIIATTTACDAISVPKRTGMAAMASLDRLAPVPCLTAGSWAILLVLPATGRYALGSQQHADVTLLSGPRHWIPLPPSHGTRWDTPPWNEQTHASIPLLHGGDVRPHLAEALAHSPGLPPVSSLTERQVRGTACVVCEVTLDNGTAVDLGEQSVVRAGQRVRWFPRACRQHGAVR